MEINEIILDFFKAKKDASQINQIQTVTSLDQIKEGLLFIHYITLFEVVQIEEFEKDSTQVRVTKGNYSSGRVDFEDKKWPILTLKYDSLNSSVEDSI